MFRKNLYKSDTLPALKVQIPQRIRNDPFYSAKNSPSKPGSLEEMQEKTKTACPTPGKKKEVDFLDLQLRTASLASNSDYKKKSFGARNLDNSINKTISTNLFKKDDPMKKIMMWEKISELKASLHKYLDQSSMPLLPTRVEVRKIIKCLEVLNDSDSGLTELMHIIVNVLKTALFVDWRVIEPFEERINEECEEELKTIIQNCKKDGAPYYVLCIGLLKELASERKKNQKEEKHKAELERLNKIIEGNEMLIAELEMQLNERIPPSEHQNLLEEIASYKTKYEEVCQENLVLKNNLSDSQEENVQLRRQVDFEAAEVDKYAAHVKTLEKAKDKVIQETEESRKQIALMKEKIKGFKDILDKIIVKLGNVKQQVLDLRHENEELLYQNEKLNLRAARGFEALTPRPDYRKLHEEKKLDMEIYDSTGRRQMVPTIKVVEELLNRIQGNARELSLSKKASNKVTMPKIFAASTLRSPSNHTKRQSISLTSKHRPSLIADPQKSGLPRETSFHSITGTSSPRNDAIGQLMPGEISQKEGKASSRNNIGEDSVEDDSQIMEVDEDNGTGNRGYLKNSSPNGLRIADSMDRRSEKSEGMFGEDTIRQANQLIDFVVTTKKAIDKLE